MSNDQIVLYFINSKSFARKFMHKTKKDLDTSLSIIKKVLLNYDQEDFSNYVKLCSKAFKTKTESKLRLVDYIINYICFLEKELDYENKREDLLKDPISYTTIFPSKITYKGHKYYYDFAFDFFFNKLENKPLRDKYKLDYSAFIKALKYIYEEGLVPVTL
jgi:hypothetical protein